MKTTAFLSLLLVGFSAAQDVCPGFDYGGYLIPELQAIKTCCDDDACPTACAIFPPAFPNGPAVKVRGGLRRKLRGAEVEEEAHRALQRLQGQPLIDACCCPGDGGGGGDPHIKVWSGDYFDFHGQCDLVLVDAPDFGEGKGLTIHIRTKIQHDYSFIESAALKIGDTDVLEVASWGEHILNGVDSAILFHKHVQGYPIDHQVLNRKTHQITVDLGDRQKLVFKTFKDWVSVTLENAHPKDFKTSKGLMGDFFTGTKLARDGTTVLEDANLFGQEWQVVPEEAGLFQVFDRAPQYPQQCVMPSAASKTASAGRRLAESDVTEEAATLACQHLADEATRKMCVYDVMATGDLDMAQAGAF